MLGYPLDHICWGEPPTDISPSFSQCCGWASPWDHYDYKTHPHKKIIRKLKNNIHSEKYPEHPWASEVTERNWGSGDLSLCLCWGWRMGHLGFHKGFPGSSAGKESAYNAGGPWFDSWVRKIPWGRDRLPTPVFLGFPGDSAGKESTWNMEDWGLISGLGRSPRDRSSYLLWYSGLENSMDCIVHGVTKSRTQMNNFHFLSGCYRFIFYRQIF